MKKLHLIPAIVLMFFGALICFYAAQLPFGTAGNPGPAMMPFGAGALLFLLVVIFLITSRPTGVSPAEPKGAAWQDLRWKTVVGAIVALLAYGLLLERLGYMLTTSLLMIYFFRGKGSKGWLIAVGVGLGIAIVSYILFDTVLQVRLPAGPFGI